MLYIMGPCRSSVAARAPFQRYLGSSVCCQRYVDSWSNVGDLNRLISPSDLLNEAAFLVNFGWVNISSQLILPIAAFLLSTFHVLFPFPVYACHSTSMCLADCTPCLQKHSGESNPGTFLECQNLLRPIFSVLIWTTKALAALQRSLYIFSVYFVDFGQMACSFLSVFLLDQTSSQRSRVFCSDASLIIHLAQSTSCFSTLCLKSYSLHFLFLLFALLHPVASLAAISASSLPLIFLWVGIHWRWISIPLALKSSICWVIVCMIYGAEHLLGLSRTCGAAWLFVKIWIPKLWFWPRG